MHIHVLHLQNRILFASFHAEAHRENSRILCENTLTLNTHKQFSIIFVLLIKRFLNITYIGDINGAHFTCNATSQPVTPKNL